MASVKQISDYVIFRLKSEGQTDLSVLKLQKLLYYIQAWHLAFFQRRAFEGEFQAWIHGPVNREIYDLYKDKKYLYSEINLDDISDPEVTEKLDEELKIHIDTILEAYAKFSGIQLEIMTHDEFPWVEAREGYKPNQRCEVSIKDTSMIDYYGARIKS